MNIDYACFAFMINKFDQTFGASNGVDTVRQQEIFPWPIDVATTIRTTLVVAPASYYMKRVGVIILSVV